MDERQLKANEDWRANKKTVGDQIAQWEEKIRRKEAERQRLLAGGDGGEAGLAEFELADLKGELAYLRQEDEELGESEPFSE